MRLSEEGQGGPPSTSASARAAAMGRPRSRSSIPHSPPGFTSRKTCRPSGVTMKSTAPYTQPQRRDEAHQAGGHLRRQLARLPAALPGAGPASSPPAPRRARGVDRVPRSSARPPRPRAAHAALSMRSWNTMGLWRSLVERLEVLGADRARVDEGLPPSMDWLGASASWPPCGRAPARRRRATRAASLVTRVRGTSSPSARASRSWRSLLLAALSRLERVDEAAARPPPAPPGSHRAPPATRADSRRARRAPARRRAGECTMPPQPHRPDLLRPRSSPAAVRSTTSPPRVPAPTSAPAPPESRLRVDAQVSPPPGQLLRRAVDRVVVGAVGQEQDGVAGGGHGE